MSTNFTPFFTYYTHKKKTVKAVLNYIKIPKYIKNTINILNNKILLNSYFLFSIVPNILAVKIPPIRPPIWHHISIPDIKNPISKL